MNWYTKHFLDHISRIEVKHSTGMHDFSVPIYQEFPTLKCSLKHFMPVTGYVLLICIISIFNANPIPERFLLKTSYSAVVTKMLCALSIISTDSM